MSSRLESRRIVAVALLALMAVVFLLTRNASATANADTARVAGVDRYATACAAAKAAFPAGTTHAVIATGENFPDALAAAAVAGDLNAPILLVHRDSVPSATSACLQQLGVTDVTIVGGDAAVDANVQQSLAKTYTVHRVSGSDRYATAAAAARALGVVCSLEGSGRTALVATGENFPDALAGGPVAFIGDGANACPILLVHLDSVPATTESALRDLNITNVIVLGGTGAVSPTAAARLATITGDASITRLSGTTREGTAVSVGNFLRDVVKCDISTVLLAGGRPQGGQTFAPDPLSAAPLGGKRCAPILLIDGPNTLGSNARGFISTNKAKIAHVIAVGGTGVVSDATLQDGGNEAKPSSTTTSSTTSTTLAGAAARSVRPELLSARVTATYEPPATASNPPSGRQLGTYVEYTFDKDIVPGAGFTAIDPTKFWVYDADGTSFQGTSVFSLTSARQVEIYFGAAGLKSVSAAARLTLATDQFGAVRDVQGRLSPEGDAPVGTSSSSGVTAGRTDAPDLTFVGSFTDDPSDTDTKVTFSFDANATLNDVTKFKLVLTNGEVVGCHAGTGTGTSSITVECSAPVGTLSPAFNTSLQSNQVARGVVSTGGVTAPSTGIPNPLEAYGVSGNSQTPDLKSVTLNLNGGPSNQDQITYEFSEGITADTQTAFRAFLANGTEVSSTSATISSSNNRFVIANFGAGQLVNATGASVPAGTVTGVGLSQNRDDELALTNTSVTTRTPGKTARPELTSVVLTGTGIPGAWQAEYTFDEVLDSSAVTAANFFLFDGAGQRFRGSSCSLAAAPNNNRVTCIAYSKIDDTGAPTGPATPVDIGTAVEGTVSLDAVEDATPGDANPEGAEPAAGGTGTPQS